MAHAKPGSRVIRISPDLHEQLVRKKPAKQSWDSFLRRAFGLQVRKATKAALIERWVLPSRTFKFIADARGAAIEYAVAAGTRKTEEPIRMREVP